METEIKNPMVRGRRKKHRVLPQSNDTTQAGESISTIIQRAVNKTKY